MSIRNENAAYFAKEELIRFLRRHNLTGFLFPLHGSQTAIKTAII
jgi:hypothetical protein